MKALNLFLDAFTDRQDQWEVDSFGIRTHHVITKVEGWVVTIVDGFRLRHARRSAVAELEGLSDDLLRDIGIERCDITAVVGQRWTSTDTQPSQATTVLRPVRIRRIDESTSSASNDRNIDSAA